MRNAFVSCLYVVSTTLDRRGDGHGYSSKSHLLSLNTNEPDLQEDYDVRQAIAVRVMVGIGEIPAPENRPARRPTHTVPPRGGQPGRASPSARHLPRLFFLKVWYMRHAYGTVVLGCIRFPYLFRIPATTQSKAKSKQQQQLEACLIMV